MSTVLAEAGATLHRRVQFAAERFAACAVCRASVLQLPVLPSNAAFGEYSGSAVACGCRLTILACVSKRSGHLLSAQDAVFLAKMGAGMQNISFLGNPFNTCAMVAYYIVIAGGC